MKKYVWVIAGSIAAIILGCSLLFHWFATELNHIEQAEQAEHVAHLTWLPPEALDISYYRSYLFTAAEFHIPEEAFAHWCDSKGFKLKTIGATPFIITRYCMPDSRQKLKILKTQALTDLQRDQAETKISESETRHISRGLFYRVELDNGGTTAAAYDRDTGIGYYESSPH